MYGPASEIFCSKVRPKAIVCLFRTLTNLFCPISTRSCRLSKFLSYIYIDRSIAPSIFELVCHAILIQKREPRPEIKSGFFDLSSHLSEVRGQQLLTRLVARGLALSCEAFMLRVFSSDASGHGSFTDFHTVTGYGGCSILLSQPTSFPWHLLPIDL